jgi:hypothetical protein
MYFSRVLLRPVAVTPALATLPNVISEENDEADKEESEVAPKEGDDDKMEMVGVDTVGKFPEEQLKQGLVTMGKGSMQWQVRTLQELMRAFSWLFVLTSPWCNV